MMGKLMVLILLPFLYFSCNNTKQIDSMNKYEWSPTTCASAKYPMKILKGSLILEDDNIISIPEGSFLINGFGELGEAVITGDRMKALPKKMLISWFSYCEDKFYVGEFDLHIEQINKEFSEGITSGNDLKKSIFNKLLIGLAPNGKIVIWLNGEKISKEICVLSAKEDTVIKWKDFIDNPDYPRKKYIRTKLEQVFKEKDFADLATNGVDTLIYIQKYRTVAEWSPEIVSSVDIKSGLFYYFNAESELFFVDKTEIKKRPIPKSIDLSWINTKGTKYSAEIKFDKDEVFKAFSKFSEIGDNRYFKMIFEISDVSAGIIVYLKDDKDIYRFEKCKIGIYK